MLATVVRYFGGVKLGAGGLVRAYTDAVASALLQAQTTPLVRMRTMHCVLPYALEGATLYDGHKEGQAADGRRPPAP